MPIFFLVPLLLNVFINAYNQSNKNDKNLISKSVHEKLCKKKINPFINELKDFFSENDLPDDYKISLKNSFIHTYEKSFSVRLIDFF